MSIKHNFPHTWANMQKLQRKISVKLEREQGELPKRVRKISKTCPLKALQVVYEYVERYFSSAKNLVACKKGCANCCHGRVWINQVEADLIADTYGLKISRIAEIMDKDTFPLRDSSRPCPFLSVDLACTIYAVRPLVCRTHFNFEPTNELCQYENADKAMPLLDRHKSIPGILAAVEEVSEAHGGGGADIRRYFGESQITVAGSVFDLPTKTDN
jgi:Fe-S-cluster containining protein